MKSLSGEVKHTALPWTYFKGNAKGVGLIRVESSSDARPSGEHICSFTRNQEANAEFIVKACNSHYELLEACKRGLGFAKEQDYLPLIRLFEQAIAKAEGK